MQESPDRLFAAKLGDMVNSCERSGAASFSHFFDERQCAEAELWCRRGCGELRYKMWGGFDDACKKMLAVYPCYCEDFIADEYPISCLTFSFRKEDRLTHRDFLGSFMAMRLKRETIGDIIIAEGKAQTFVTEVAARLILSTVSKIGRVGVKITDSQPFSLEVRQEFESIGGTAVSLRLDCVVGIAARVSREKASRLIRAERVAVNHFPITSVSHMLNQGDVISIRGFGKFVLSDINGLTKKGRIHITLRKYK